MDTYMIIGGFFLSLIVVGAIYKYYTHNSDKSDKPSEETKINKSAIRDYLQDN